MIDPETQEAAARAVDEPFSLDGRYEVVRAPRQPSIVYSARIPAQFTDEITDAAAAAGVTPSRMIAILVEEALQARRMNPSRVVTVDLAVLHRAIDQAARAA